MPALGREDADRAPLVRLDAELQRDRRDGDDEPERGEQRDSAARLSSGHHAAGRCAIGKIIGSARIGGAVWCSPDSIVRRTAVGVIVAACDARNHRFVRSSRNSTCSVSIVESSILRTSGSCAFGWYSIVRPFSGVLSSRVDDTDGCGRFRGSAGLSRAGRERDLVARRLRRASPPTCCHAADAAAPRVAARAARQSARTAALLDLHLPRR